MSALRRSAIEDSQLICRAGIHEGFFSEKPLSGPDGYIFWIRVDMKGRYWLFVMKPSGKGGPMTTELRRPPQGCGRNAEYVLTGDQWRVVQRIARSVDPDWRP